MLQGIFAKAMILAPKSVKQKKVDYTSFIHFKLTVLIQAFMIQGRIHEGTRKLISPLPFQFPLCYYCFSFPLPPLSLSLDFFCHS